MNDDSPVDRVIVEMKRKLWVWELLKEGLKRIDDNLDWGVTEKIQAKEFRSLDFNGENKWEMKYMSIKGEIRRSQFWGESDNFIGL